MASRVLGFNGLKPKLSCFHADWDEMAADHREYTALLAARGPKKKNYHVASDSNCHLYNQVHASWTPTDIEAIVYLNGSKDVDAARALETARRIQAWFDAGRDLLGSKGSGGAAGGARRPSVPIVQHLLTSECGDAPAAMRRVRTHANGTRPGDAAGLFVDA